MLNERYDPALILEYLLFDRFLPLILERDFKPFVQKGELPQSLRQHVETEVECLENLLVRLECDHRPATLGFTRHFQGTGRLAALVPLLKYLAVLPNLQLEPFRESVDN